MRVLLIKMSSMGDVVHTFPALTDAARAIPGLQVDWVVEEAFAGIAARHPAVERVIEVAIRRWRKAPLASRREFLLFRNSLKAQPYDFVLDAQGLLKSAAVACMARGRRCGYARDSAREPIASFAYSKRVSAPAGLHAIEKMRYLFAEALGYSSPLSEVDYGLVAEPGPDERKQLMFLHGTTWSSKHWPLPYWQSLARLVVDAGYTVLLPHGDEREELQAEDIALGVDGAEVLPRLPIDDLVDTMAGVQGVVSVDTGLGHLACALDLPMVAMYGPTDPKLTGPVSRFQSVLSSNHLSCIPCLQRVCQFEQASSDIYPPCFEPIDPGSVWQQLQVQMKRKTESV